MTYGEFIKNILDNRGRFACGDEYHERHHIVPECCGGTNDKDNLIDLFAREHFDAHRLLALENPDNEGLVYAWWMMSQGKNQDRITHIVTAEEYEESKIAFSKIHSKEMVGSNNPMYGKNHTKETRDKMSQNRIGKYRGKNNIRYGTHLPNETREKISDKAKERCQKPESNPMYGKHHSKESRDKISKSRIGKYGGANNANSRQIIRLIDLKVYGYCSEAAEDNNVSCYTIWRHCKSHKGFMYYDEYLTQQNDYKEE